MYISIFFAFLMSAHTITAVDASPAAAPAHDAWDALLQKHVSKDGRVDYEGFVKNKKALQDYLDLLLENPPMDDWTQDERLAYLINAYNAFTVKLIVDNYPVKSIKDLHDGEPWDVKWIKMGRRTYSLNNIEHDLIRQLFDEPRIHFAVNCAALSCPPLLNRAWTAETLETYFEQQTKAFINNSRYNKVSAEQAQLSQIFNWYGEDFGNLHAYVNRYAKTKVNKGAKISFMEYDWALNGR